MYKAIQKSLDWGVKIASLAVTGPATWQVSAELFKDVQSPLILFLMQFAAVFLVEGVLLSNWLLLEFDKNATPEIKVRYGVTALVMYAALLVIAWKHEGPTGIVFRLALLAALVGSGWDTYVYTWHRMGASVDRSAENSGKVKRHARNLSIKEAMMRREAEHQATVAIISAENNAALHHTQLYGERLLDRINLDDKSERLQLMDENDALERDSSGKKKRLPTLPPSVARSARRELPYTSAPDPAIQELRASILGALAADPNYEPGALSERLGYSQQQVKSTVAHLLEEGALYQDGEGTHVAQGVQHPGNGKRYGSKPTTRGR